MEKFRTSLISNVAVSQFYLPRYQPTQEGLHSFKHTQFNDQPTALPLQK